MRHFERKKTQIVGKSRFFKPSFLTHILKQQKSRLSNLFCCYGPCFVLNSILKDICFKRAMQNVVYFQFVFAYFVDLISVV